VRRQWNHAHIDYGTGDRSDVGQHGIAGQHFRCAPATSNVAPNLLLAFPREGEQYIVV
jgi:hypothetical protein